MAKQKIADLPQEEQDKLTAQLKELKIRGVYSTFTVEKAQELIKKAQENAENTDTEDKTDDAAQNDAQDAETKEDDQKDETAQENAENDDLNADKKPAETKKAAKVENEPQAPKLRCHICLSPVINGKCTGCGFELKK